jgi:hypothetical protein
LPFDLQLLTTPRGQHDQQLLVPLIVLMAQHLDWTLYTLHTEHVKEVAELYDKISYTTQQVSQASSDTDMGHLNSRAYSATEPVPLLPPSLQYLMLLEQLWPLTVTVTVTWFRICLNTP